MRQNGSSIYRPLHAVIMIIIMNSGGSRDLDLPMTLKSERSSIGKEYKQWLFWRSHTHLRVRSRIVPCRSIHYTRHTERAELNYSRKFSLRSLYGDLKKTNSEVVYTELNNFNHVHPLSSACTDHCTYKKQDWTLNVTGDATETWL